MIGSLVELMCVVRDRNISRMEWTTQSTDTVLASVNHTDHLLLLVNTSQFQYHSNGSTVFHRQFTCTVTTSEGIKLQKSTILNVRSK